MNNFPIYLVFRSGTVNICVDETSAKYQSDSNILRTNLGHQQVWDLTDFYYIQCQQTFKTVPRISADNKQNSTQQNAVKLKKGQQKVKAAVKRLT